MKTTTRFYLNEKQWSKIKNLLPAERGRCARPSKDNRLMLEGMIWKLRTGAPWRDLPRETFGPWESVYTRFSRWSFDGIFQKVFDFIKDDLENDVAILDSTTVRAHQHSHGAVRKKVNKK
jgi:transposase